MTLISTGLGAFITRTVLALDLVLSWLSYLQTIDRIRYIHNSDNPGLGSGLVHGSSTTVMFSEGPDQSSVDFEMIEPHTCRMLSQGFYLKRLQWCGK